MVTDRGWIGVDLDGTLAHYTHWVGPHTIGDPVWPMVERVKQWLADGKQVKIFTARIVNNHIVSPSTVRAVEEWCLKHIGVRLPVTCVKDMGMIELWDDRAVQVEPNTGEPTTYWKSRA